MALVKTSWLPFRNALDCRDRFKRTDGICHSSFFLEADDASDERVDACRLANLTGARFEDSVKLLVMVTSESVHMRVASLPLVNIVDSMRYREQNEH
jgi:hypothetical protein